jgi:polyferredoxin
MTRLRFTVYDLRPQFFQILSPKTLTVIKTQRGYMVTLFGKRIRFFRPKSIWLRKIVQWGFFVLIALIAINHTLAESGQTIPLLANASLHAVCPFGGVVTLYQFATVGTFVQKIHQSSFVLMMISLLLAILFGPVFCGWVCPLGTIQEWVSGFGRKLFRRRFNHFIPAKLDWWLRFLRYGVLAWVLYMTAVTGTLIFAVYDPYLAMFNFWTSEVSIIGVVILGLTLGLSLLVERPWCKYACPYMARCWASPTCFAFLASAAMKALAKPTALAQSCVR